MHGGQRTDDRRRRSPGSAMPTRNHDDTAAVECHLTIQDQVVASIRQPRGPLQGVELARSRAWNAERLHVPQQRGFRTRSGCCCGSRPRPEQPAATASSPHLALDAGATRTQQDAVLLLMQTGQELRLTADTSRAGIPLAYARGPPRKVLFQGMFLRGFLYFYFQVYGGTAGLCLERRWGERRWAG